MTGLRDSMFFTHSNTSTDILQTFLHDVCNKVCIKNHYPAATYSLKGRYSHKVGNLVGMIIGGAINLASWHHKKLHYLFYILTLLRVRLDITYFTENWKYCSKIIFKCVNSIVSPMNSVWIVPFVSWIHVHK